MYEYTLITELAVANSIPFLPYEYTGVSHPGGVSFEYVQTVSQIVE